MNNECEEELRHAKREAETLAMAMWELWYKDASPNFELLPTVAGVITQINNMASGLEKAQPGDPSRH